MNVPASQWPAFGVAYPDEIDPHLALVRESNGLIWVRASRRFTAESEHAHFRSRALAVHETIRSTRLVRDQYIEAWPPKEFFGDYAIAVRLTLRGHEAITAIEAGFCWDTERHEPEPDHTLAYWRDLLRSTRNPHASVFERLRKVQPPELHVLRGEADQRRHAVWRERVDGLTNVYAHDWAEIVGTRDPQLAIVSEFARARHNQMWIDELQSITDVDDRRFAAVNRLNDEKYRDVKNEAMAVKMRVWRPLDNNGRRFR